MERQAVESKLLQSVGYDPVTKVLEAHYQPSKKNPEGSIYRYEDVLPEEYDRLMVAKSIGSHMLKHIIPNRTASKVVPEKENEEKEQSKTAEA